VPLVLEVPFKDILALGGLLDRIGVHIHGHLIIITITLPQLGQQLIMNGLQLFNLLQEVVVLLETEVL
jgi:hypothetical protein